MAAPASSLVPRRVLIAGGGTGGHLFPGLAVAEALRKRVPGSDIRFAGSKYGIEHHLVPERGYTLYRIPVRGLYGVSWGRRMRVLAMLPVALIKCAAILLRFRPHLVLGVGGYASGPMLATALLLGRRCVIQEQNAHPGITNRLLGRLVHTAFTAVRDEGGFFRRAVVTGNPVRADILALRSGTPTESPENLLFVFGGSQGARVINRAMMEALPLLHTAVKAAGEWTGKPLRILHQTGTADLDEVRAAYDAADLPAEVVPFLEDMAGAYRKARVVVSRAGASAVSEIVTARRASILIPIPGTSGDHQFRNAQQIAAAGAGLLIEQKNLTGEALAGALLALLKDPARLDAMEAATDALYTGDAADKIAELCLEIMG